MLEYFAYLNDPLTLDFDAHVIEKTPRPDGTVDVVLERTWFYPTGGGQSHDVGTLGERRVRDVFKNDAGQVIHRLDGDLSAPVVPARIDPPRRLGNMQHHSAQHIVSWAFERELGLETLSAHISAKSPSTIDVPQTQLSPADFKRVEDVVNALVFENRPIKTYFITDVDMDSIPFRRPPKVRGAIRVVEVDGLDYSACGGTHCPQTGMIGLIKLLNAETVNQKTRVHFVAGTQALAYFRRNWQIVSEVAAHFNTAPAQVPEVAARQTEQLGAALKTIDGLKGKLLAVEGAEMLAKARQVGGVRLVMATFAHRPVAELRRLLKHLHQPDTVALLATFDGDKASLLVRCGEKTGVNANALLQNHLALIDGRGGGSAEMAQGGGKTSGSQFEVLFAATDVWVKNMSRR